MKSNNRMYNKNKCKIKTIKKKEINTNFNIRKQKKRRKRENKIKHFNTNIIITFFSQVFVFDVVVDALKTMLKQEQDYFTHKSVIKKYFQFKFNKIINY